MVPSFGALTIGDSFFFYYDAFKGLGNPVDVMPVLPDFFVTCFLVRLAPFPDSLIGKFAF